MENKLKELEESIGGDNPDKFGPNGELHSLRDECFSVEAGKYEYEVCMFGSASQKDKGSKGGGTNLGRWKEATIETVTGDRANGHQEYQQRVWKWENGTKCWNGPKRSATVYVTCGAENKVLSADEPDTCRYELEMESPIACDDDFRVRHGL
jgi:protein kinase C substrate 80K-H